MLTTIEDLEKEIDIFHKNVSNSNELVSLIDLTQNALEKQSSDLCQKADELHGLISTLPDNIKLGNKDLVEQLLNSLSMVQEKFEQALDSAQKEYTKRFAQTEKVVSSIPGELKKDNESALAKQVELLKKVQDNYVIALKEYLSDFASRLEGFGETAGQLSDSLSAEQEKFKQALNSVQKDTVEGFAETEKVVSSTLKAHKDDLISQLNESIRVAQELSLSLEEKQNTFIEKLESTSIGQIYACYHDMNKSLNKKLCFLIGWVVTFTIVSFFIRG